MSIFNRRDDQQTSTAPSPEMGAQGVQPDHTAKLMPPFVPPGVVPPPAAPIYSMRPPESAPRFEDAESPVAETVTVAAEAQRRAREGIHGRLEVAVQRTRSGASTAQGAGRRPAQRAAPVGSRAPRLRHRQSFDPVAAAQAGLLNLAWRWQEAGSPIRAIHTYMQLLTRYPDTPAAAAAVADLVELSEKLAGEGQFHTALGIYDQLEELLA